MEVPNLREVIAFKEFVQNLRHDNFICRAIFGSEP